MNDTTDQLIHLGSVKGIQPDRSHLTSGMFWNYKDKSAFYGVNTTII